MSPIDFNQQGLVPAVAQDHATGQVRMLAWMNAEALARTIASGRATFFSRSRQRLWEKGEQSGHTLRVRRIIADCDADALLLLVDPEGPTCHTGNPTCFFRNVSDTGELTEVETESGPFIHELEATIRARQTATAGQSYTKSLLEGGRVRIGEKLREEASELAVALTEESDARVASEAADLVYHLLVGLRSRGIEWRRVIEVLADRAGTSGHSEKSERGRRTDE